MRNDPSKNPMSRKIKRCAWAGNTSAAYIEYHDKEWGVPVWDDRTQFVERLLQARPHEE